MSRRSSWSWRRWIDPAREEEWIGRLPEGAAWVVTEKPGRVRAVLTVHVSSRAEAERLARNLGGQTARLEPAMWLKPVRSAPVRIGSAWEIVHEKPSKRNGAGRRQLYLPHGIAFGSGEHATTAMLLRALARTHGLDRSRLLDLGTGSGILALAARCFGATRILASDWDADAVRTARQNEALNFTSPLIRWRQADVRQLKLKSRHDLVLANLFSGILCAAARPIARSVVPGGRLWLSGILRGQEREVIRAYRAQKLHLELTRRRGKWLALFLTKRCGPA
jgi:ribosomal protein L11 methyltransferase